MGVGWHKTPKQGTAADERARARVLAHIDPKRTATKTGKWRAMMRKAAGGKSSAALVEVFGDIRLMASKIVAYRLLGDSVVIHYQVGQVAYTFEITDPQYVVAAAAKLRGLFESVATPPQLAEHLAREPDDKKEDPRIRVKRLTSTDAVGEKLKAPAAAMRK